MQIRWKNNSNVNPRGLTPFIHPAMNANILILIIATILSASLRADPSQNEFGKMPPAFGKGLHRSSYPVATKDKYYKISTLEKENWVYDAEIMGNESLVVSRKSIKNPNIGIDKLVEFNESFGSVGAFRVGDVRIVDVWDQKNQIAILLSSHTGYTYLRLGRNTKLLKKDGIFLPLPGSSNSNWNVEIINRVPSKFGFFFVDSGHDHMFSDISFDSIDIVQLVLRENSEKVKVNFSGKLINVNGRNIEEPLNDPLYLDKNIFFEAITQKAKPDFDRYIDILKSRKVNKSSLNKEIERVYDQDQKSNLLAIVKTLQMPE